MLILILTACLYDRAQYLSYLEEFSDDDQDGYPGYADCNDEDPDIHPEVDEYCDGVDNDCDGEVDNNALDTHLWYQDLDMDTYGNTEITREGCTPPAGYADNGEDCDDDAADIYPNAPESCTQAVDQNCDGLAGNLDADGDGVPACDDCEDSDPEISPDLTEICDGKDNDCSGQIDDNATDATLWFEDLDGDGFGNPAVSALDCERPPNTTAQSGDCDDNNREASPAGDEICGDGLDNDCDGTPNNCRPEDNLQTGASLETTEAGQTGVFSTALGDIDGDGTDDFMISSAAYANGGAVWMVLGPVTGDMTLETESALYLYGENDSLAQKEILGDINDDGIRDLILWDEYSQAQGLEKLSFISETERGSHSISEVAHTRIWGTQEIDAFGCSLALGDVDNDGDEDALIGAMYHYDDNFYMPGAAYLLEGPLSGEHTANEATATFMGDEGTDMSIGRNTLLYDINGDGFLDPIITAKDIPGGATNEGGMAMYLGPVSGTLRLADADMFLLGSVDEEFFGFNVYSPGDETGDGLDDFWIGSADAEIAGQPSGAVYYMESPLQNGEARDLASVTLIGEAPRDNFGATLSIGDIDRDGIMDIWTGATAQSQAGYDAGKAYLFYGPFAGTRSATDADAYHLGSGSYAHGAYGLKILGDVNGDEEIDLLFGEFAYNQKGRSVVLFGYSY